jgi:hypothetical protein
MTETPKMVFLSDQLHTLSTSSMVSEPLASNEQKTGRSQKLVQTFLGKGKIDCPA